MRFRWPNSLAGETEMNTRWHLHDLTFSRRDGFDFREMDLRYTCMRGMFAQGAIFRRSLLNNADLRWVHATDADFARVQMREARCRGGTFTGANFWSADLRWCDLRDADLRGANFTLADLRGADLTGAKTEGAVFSLALRNWKSKEEEYAAAYTSYMLRYVGVKQRPSVGGSRSTPLCPAN